MEEIIHCKDCKYAVLTCQNQVKYCKAWQADEDGGYSGEPLYLDADFFCGFAEKKNSNPEQA